MAAIFLSETDVEQLLTMEIAIEAVETVFRKHAMTEVANIARGRARTDMGMLHIMGSAAKTLNAMCCKVYTTTQIESRFLLHLYDGHSGELLAIMQAESLGAIRTGATSGVATQHMARSDADTVGVFGSGRQARTQLEAVCQVRNIEEAYVFSRKEENRNAFAREMSAVLGVDVKAVSRPELAAEDKDIVITATRSSTPVLSGEWIGPGTHINAIGSNFLGRSELDLETIRKCDPIVVEDKEQARLEAGDFGQAMEAGIIRWSDIVELGNVVVDRYPGRHGPDDVTLFKSVGVSFEDLAVARKVFDLAKAAGMGVALPF